MTATRSPDPRVTIQAIKTPEIPRIRTIPKSQGNTLLRERSSA
jgi:hypothetical protein